MAPIKGDDGFSGIPVPAPGTAGVLGDSAAGYGVAGLSGGPAGVYGESSLAGDADVGSPGGSGVLGVNDQRGGVGVQGRGAVCGVLATGNTGVLGYGIWAAGVQGSGKYSDGVVGVAGQGAGVRARSNNVAIHARNTLGAGHDAYLATTGIAGDFYGDIYVHGVVNKSAVGFIIDHPIEPANRYLRHGGVESSEWKNIYDGIAVLDGNGEARVELPSWFDALNKDFRYQLTCLGQHAPVFVAQKVKHNHFRIGGGSPGLEVAWQVTGLRQDAWAKAHPLHVEQDKPEAERGSFLYPSLYGEPEEKSVRRARYPDTPQINPQELPGSR